MKQKRFSEERILKILREAEVPGVSIGEVCRRSNITDVTFYRWRNKYGGLDKAEILKLKALEIENAKGVGCAGREGRAAMSWLGYL